MQKFRMNSLRWNIIYVGIMCFDTPSQCRFNYNTL